MRRLNIWSCLISILTFWNSILKNKFGLLSEKEKLQNKQQFDLLLNNSNTKEANDWSSIKKKMFKQIEKYVESYPKIWYLYVEVNSSHTTYVTIRF